MKPVRTRRAALAATSLAAALLLAACGGGGSGTADTTPRLSISSVKVFGDSIQDSGTFGYKFTVQTPDNLIYAERIAANYGQTLCNFFVFTGTTFAPNSKAGCTNFAIGGGRITYTGAGGAANPLNIGTQMATYASAGSFSASDLVIIDGGGNDAADLVTAYLKAKFDQAASYSALLGTLLQPAQIGAALQGGVASTGAIGGDYMKALAGKFYGQIKTSVLDKGATHVVLLNMPGITNTPRFQMVLDGIKAATVSGAKAQGASDTAAEAAGAKARDDSEMLFKSWITAFNAELAGKVGGDDRVVLVDFYTAFNDQVTMPAQFGLSNVKTPACPIVGVGSDGLPTYDFPTCTGTALSAAPQAGASGGADWWKSYAFSDGFHPTPYGHQLTQQLIAKALAVRGWL
jgi:phospholipase/lecithinase/hemolysin